MKKIGLTIALILSLLVSHSSCSFLDVQDYYDEILPYDSVFHNTRNLQKYLWTIPTSFGDEGAFIAHCYTPGPLATDEGISAFNNSYDDWTGTGYVTGFINPDRLSNLGIWDEMYRVVRRVNILLSRMNEATDLTPTDRAEIVGYAKFMRAYAYYRNLMNSGPLILVGDEVLHNNQDELYYGRHRATYDESIDYICNEFEEAAKLMPVKVLTSEFGRPMRGSAYGLIARLRLQQASPAYNGGDVAKSYFGAWTRSVDGVHYISQEYDERKWAVAAAAAKRVMEMGIYELYTVPKDEETMQLPANISSENFPDGAGDIDPFKSYSDMFTGEAVTERNKEYIWATYSANLTDRTRNCFAKTLFNGSNGLSVTQKIVNAYRMVDGRDINNSSADYPYQPDIMNQGNAKSFSGYYLPKDISGMYVNREMRFYASIGFNARFWPCESSADGAFKNLIIKYSANGNAGKNDAGTTSDYPLTGYILTKMIHKDDAWKGTGARVWAKPYAMIRYAEILLAYVEAMNNLTADYSITLPIGVNEEKDFHISRNTNEMKAAFNQVRYRAGMPGLSAAELNNAQEMQALLEKELMVEFLFENRRYFDVRRWGIYEKTETEPITGMNMDAAEPEFYNIVSINHRHVRERVVHKKMMFVPIPRSELNRVRGMDQNPGWN